jgi:hypothetical protein
MSSHKLGDYCASRSAFEREKIVREQVVPPTFQAARYADADSAIRRSLLRGSAVEPACMSEAARIRSKPVIGAWREQSRDCSAESVEAFAHLWSGLGIEDAERVFVGRPSLGEQIEGLTVSSRPLVLLKQRHRRGVRFGALFLIHRKDKATTSDAAQIVATLLARGLAAAGIAGREEVDPSLCIVLDVFHGGVFRAPQHIGRALRDVKSACREVVVRWQSIVDALSA